MAETSKRRARAADKVEVSEDRPSTIFSEWPFPTDRYGVTSRVRREVHAAMSRTHGYKDKCDAVEQTLESLLAWVKARRVELEHVRAKRAEKAETRRD